MLQLSLSIQTARVEMSIAGKQSSLTAPRTQLNAAIAAAKRLGHYGIECEARLARAKLEAKADPQAARIRLMNLASESRSRGFELVARQAEQAIAASRSSISAANGAVR
jgi:hypothetical protein